MGKPAGAASLLCTSGEFSYTQVRHIEKIETVVSDDIVNQSRVLDYGPGVCEFEVGCRRAGVLQSRVGFDASD